MRTACVCKLILSETYSMKYILLVLLSYMLRLICSQPGDPGNKGIEENKDRKVIFYDELQCPRMCLSSVVKLEVQLQCHQLLIIYQTNPVFFRITSEPLYYQG